MLWAFELSCSCVALNVLREHQPLLAVWQTGLLQRPPGLSFPKAYFHCLRDFMECLLISCVLRQPQD